MLPFIISTILLQGLEYGLPIIMIKTWNFAHISAEMV